MSFVVWPRLLHNTTTKSYFINYFLNINHYLMDNVLVGFKKKVRGKKTLSRTSECNWGWGGNIGNTWYQSLASKSFIHMSKIYCLRISFVVVYYFCVNYRNNNATFAEFSKKKVSCSSIFRIFLLFSNNFWIYLQNFKVFVI